MSDAALVLELFAIDPIGLGGVWLRGAGPGRDAWVAEVERLFSAASQKSVHPERSRGTHFLDGTKDSGSLDFARDGRIGVRRLPVGIDDDRLIGGVDLAASLAAGRPVRHAGLLDEARGGVVIVQGAERARDMLTGRLAQAMDAGGPAAVLVDDGRDEERAPVALTDRVAFWLDFSDLVPESVIASEAKQSIRAEAGLLRFARNDGGVSEEVLRTIAVVAEAFGVNSPRAMIFTVRTARAHAVLCGRDAVTEEDVTVAAPLVLGPRATRVPADADAEPAPADRPPPEPGDAQPLEDVVLAAVKASLPARLLEELAGGRSMARGATPRGSGARKRSRTRGRPVGARPGFPGAGLRLALVDTLRAAAPWQKLRGGGPGRILLRKDDFRVKRFEDRETALTVFAVDASGSAAFARLAEAKGAVELLLQRAYATRAEVALIAFRGTGAELLLPPTRSLTRARRELADLPGGGGTPLAAGLDAARELADAARKRGRTPQIVVLTDGRANIAADGSQGRAQGVADAMAAGKRLAAGGFKSVVIDIGPRSQGEAAALAAAMAGRMIHLPRADAEAVSAAVGG